MVISGSVYFDNNEEVILKNCTFKDQNIPSGGSAFIRA